MISGASIITGMYNMMRAAQIQANADGEKTRIADLDAALSQERTPYLKERLRLAMNSTQDVRTLLRLAEQAEAQYAQAWLAIAEGNITMAATTRQQVQELVDTYGSPDKVIESGRV